MRGSRVMIIGALSGVLLAAFAVWYANELLKV